MLYWSHRMASACCRNISALEGPYVVLEQLQSIPPRESAALLLGRMLSSLQPLGCHSG